MSFGSKRLIYLGFSIFFVLWPEPAIDLSLDIRPIVIASQSWTVSAFRVNVAQSLSLGVCGRTPGLERFRMLVPPKVL